MHKTLKPFFSKIFFFKEDLPSNMPALLKCENPYASIIMLEYY